MVGPCKTPRCPDMACRIVSPRAFSEASLWSSHKLPLELQPAVRSMVKLGSSAQCEET